jgi:hypothetical protein
MNSKQLKIFKTYYNGTYYFSNSSLTDTVKQLFDLNFLNGVTGVPDPHQVDS